MVHGQADVSTRLSEAAELFERSVSGDMSFCSEACDLVVQWIRGRFASDPQHARMVIDRNRTGSAFDPLSAAGAFAKV
jgi:hypothetical protein